jgi:hypothetical protein
MAELDPTLVAWTTRVTELIRHARNGLSYLAPRELDGDPNEGITELGFKLVLMTGLGIGEQLQDLQVESERSVEGGRIDLFMYHEASNSALVVELKYVRIGFIETTKEAFNLPFLQKHRKWKEEDDNIALMTTQEKCQIHVRNYSTNRETKKKEMSLVSVHTIMLKAVNQASRYCHALREGGLRRLDTNVRLFQVGIIGIGKSVITTSVHEFISEI